MYSDDLPNCKKCTDQIEPCDTGAVCGKCSNETAAILERLDSRIEQIEQYERITANPVSRAAHHVIVLTELRRIKTGLWITQEDLNEGGN